MLHGRPAFRPGSIAGKHAVLKYNIWLLTHPDLYDQPKVKVLMQFLTNALMAKRALVEGDVSVS